VDGYNDNNCPDVDISGTLICEKKLVSEATIEQLPWIEKYRPRLIEDVILDENILTKINHIIDDKNMPNIIITGIPGIGKTTTIKCIARKLYGKYINQSVLELNASDDRGIKIVEDSITNFCKKAVEISSNNNITYAKHKLIILDEADNITSKAQYSINKKMQEYSNTTRFAFTCNKSTDIIEAIQSRCIIFRYLRLPLNKIIEKLTYICSCENILYDKEALREIAILAQGDMRAAINILQMVYNGLQTIIIDNVYKICDKPQPIYLEQILHFCKQQNITEAFKIIRMLTDKGYPESDIILGLINVLKLLNTQTLICESDKQYIYKKICKSAYYISKGINTRLQLYSCISNIIDGFHTNNLSMTELD
jgi:replication factor C subunit 2/4